MIRLVIAGAATAAAVLGTASGWGSPAWWALPLLAVAVAGGELAVFSLAIGRQRWVVSSTDGAVAAALLLAPGGWLVLALAAGVVLANWQRRLPPIKIAFNAAQFSAAGAAGALATTVLGGGMVAACMGAAAFWLINSTLVGAVVSITSGQRLLPLLRDGLRLATVTTAGNCSVGLLAAWLAINAPLGLIGLLVPIGLLITTYDLQARRAGEARLFAELAARSDDLEVRSVDTSARVVVSAAAGLLGGADVELLLLGAEGPVRYAGNETGVEERHRADTALFDSPEVLRALGAGRLTVGVDSGRPWCSAVLGRPDRPLAILLARRAAGSDSFGRRETALLAVLVGQAEAWLSVVDLRARHDDAVGRADAADEAARALGDIGADTAPALSVLRDSAARLARLARATSVAGAPGPDALRDVVDELHSVERAVASLLGAVVLAAEPDLVTARLAAPVAVPGPAPERAAADWTTTGVLTP